MFSELSGLTAVVSALAGAAAMASVAASAELRVVTDALAPEEATVINKSDVELSRPSSISPMPAGLLNSLTREEILDLLAFLQAGGNPNHPAFGP